MQVDTDQPILPFADMAVSVADNLVVDEAGVPSLTGGQCHSCGVQFFPARTVCPKCTSDNVTTMALPRTGELYTYSSIHVSASRKVPYHLGYIDLPGDVRLLAELRGEQDSFAIGSAVTLQHEGDDWFFVNAGEQQ